MTERSSPELHVFPDYAHLSISMAQALVQLGENAIQARGRFLLVLNGGGTPQQLFENLGQQPFRSSAIWPFTHLFWGDERCVSPTDPTSNYFQARETFIAQVGIPAEHVHRIKGESGPGKAAVDYAGLLESMGEGGRRWPIFDLVLLGVGEDGHTASLFPGNTFEGSDRAVVAVRAAYQGRPADRVSLTPAVFNTSRRVFFMAAGVRKSGVVRQVLAGARAKEALPVQAIRSKISTWWLDSAAASGLER